MINKLKSVERTINIYSDKEDPKLIEEIRLDLPLDLLKEVVTCRDDDPMLYRAYILIPEQLEKINNNLPVLISPDYSLYFYVLECHGVYDWK